MNLNFNLIIINIVLTININHPHVQFTVAVYIINIFNKKSIVVAFFINMFIKLSVFTYGLYIIGILDTFN